MTRSRIDPAFAHWFAGFTDGEGCFVIAPCSNAASYACHLVICLRADDKPILEEIRRQTGCGGQLYDRYPTSDEGKRSPSVQWHVQRRDECLRVVKLFDQFPLRAKKKRDFAVWRQAVIEWDRLASIGGRYDWSRMAALREQLQALRGYESADPVELPEPDHLQLALVA